MNIVPIIDAHFDGFTPQEEQIAASAILLDGNYRDQITTLPDSYAGVIDGKVIAFAGVAMIYQHIGTAWAILGEGSENHLLPLTKAVRGFLDDHPSKRIETAVRRDFAKGHKWARMLGFTNETPGAGMKNFGIDGMTYDLYARYK